MSSAAATVAEEKPDSRSPSPVDDWENDNDSEAQTQQLQERFKQVRIMKRAEADKQQRIADARREEEERREHAEATGIKPAANPVTAPAPKPFRLMRRPDSSSNVAREGEEEASGDPAAAPGTLPKRGSGKTLEERQAEYDAARQRILGSDYNPTDKDIPAAPAVPVVRARSPEVVTVPRFAMTGGHPSGMSLGGGGHQQIVGGPMAPPPSMYHMQSQHDMPYALPLNGNSAPSGPPLHAMYTPQMMHQQQQHQQQYMMDMSRPPPPMSQHQQMGQMYYGGAGGPALLQQGIMHQQPRAFGCPPPHLMMQQQQPPPQNRRH